MSGLSALVIILICTGSLLVGLLLTWYLLHRELRQNHLAVNSRIDQLLEAKDRESDLAQRISYRVGEQAGMLAGQLTSAQTDLLIKEAVRLAMTELTAHLDATANERA